VVVVSQKTPSISQTTILSNLPQDTIAILHNATTAGVVPVVAELLTSERLALSRDQVKASLTLKIILLFKATIWSNFSGPKKRCSKSFGPKNSVRNLFDRK
jgi:glycerol-3-phosphate O-acyltransferase